MWRLFIPSILILEYSARGRYKEKRREGRVCGVEQVYVGTRIPGQYTNCHYDRIFLSIVAEVMNRSVQYELGATSGGSIQPDALRYDMNLYIA